jgi:hypothetical protein
VYDAYSVYEDIFEDKEIVKATDHLRASWSGEWCRFNEQSTNPTNVLFEANQTKMVYIPAGAEEVEVSLSWPLVDLTQRIVGTLGFDVDTDSNGGWDYQSSISPDLDGSRIETVPVSGSDGRYWTFGIEGHGVKWHRILEQQQFKEARIEYEMSVSITFGQGFGTIEVPPLSKGAIVADLKFAQPTDEYTMGNISMMKPVYDLNAVSWEPGNEPPPVPESSSSGLGWWLLLLFILVVLVVAFVIAKQQPESTAGRRIRLVYLAVGADKILDRTRRVVRNVTGKVIRSGDDVTKTDPRVEVVEEHMDAAEEEAGKIAKGASSKKGSPKKKDEKPVPDA